MNPQSVTIALITFALTGCCTQVRQAGLQHAKTTRQVGQTVEAAADRLDCGAMNEPSAVASCEASKQVLEQQADALGGGADVLEQEMGSS
jgi:hypothetical protein